MKKLTAILLAVLLLLSLAACGGPGTEPGDQTTAAGDPAGSGAAPDPGKTDDPYPTQSPERAVFNPETDYDNRYAHMQLCAFVETEDAYYIEAHANSYLYYCDKGTGDFGVLCPRPECMHDYGTTLEERQACDGALGAHGSPLAYYEGMLYWVANYYPARSLCLFRIGLDGSGRELVRKISLPEDRNQPQRFWIHRGYIYMYVSGPMVVNGSPTNYQAAIRVPMFEEGYEEILYRQSYRNGAWTLRFVGDDVYICGSWDGVDESFFGKEPETWEELKDWDNVDFIARWNPAMAEPQILLEEHTPYWIYRETFYVCPDGTILFVRDLPEDPAIHFWEEGFQIREHLIRLDPDGTETEVFDNYVDGERWNMRLLFDGGIFLMKDTGTKPDTRVVCIMDLEGGVLYEGDLPTAYRARAPRGTRFMGMSDFYFGDGYFVACMQEYDPNDYYHQWWEYYIRYDITPEGLQETFLAEAVQTILRQ